MLVHDYVRSYPKVLAREDRLIIDRRVKNILVKAKGDKAVTNRELGILKKQIDKVVHGTRLTEAHYKYAPEGESEASRRGHCRCFYGACLRLLQPRWSWVFS